MKPLKLRMSFVQLVLSSSSGFTAPNSEALNCRLSPAFTMRFCAGALARSTSTACC